MGSGRSAPKVPAPTCFVDGRVCDGKWVLGAPACAGVTFFYVGSDGRKYSKTRDVCPRFKSNVRSEV